MKLSSLARQRLRGNRCEAVTAECAVLCARLALAITELALFALCGAPGIGDAPAGQTSYAAVLFAVLIADWLLISPLLIGRAVIYWDIVQSRPTSASRIMSGFSVYKKALLWRLGRFVRRFFWSTVCYAPTVFLLGYIPLLRRAPETGINNALLLVLTAAQLVFPFAGLLMCESMMLRYLPAECLIAASNGSVPMHRLFSKSRKMMRGNVGALMWVSFSFAGWGLLSALIAPAIYSVPVYRTSRIIALRRCMAESETGSKKRKTKRGKKEIAVSQGAQ